MRIPFSHRLGCIWECAVERDTLYSHVYTERCQEAEKHHWIKATPLAGEPGRYMVVRQYNEEIAGKSDFYNYLQGEDMSRDDALLFIRRAEFEWQGLGFSRDEVQPFSAKIPAVTDTELCNVLCRIENDILTVVDSVSPGDEARVSYLVWRGYEALTSLACYVAAFAEVPRLDALRDEYVRTVNRLGILAAGWIRNDSSHALAVLAGFEGVALPEGPVRKRERGSDPLPLR